MKWDMDLDLDPKRGRGYRGTLSIHLVVNCLICTIDVFMGYGGHVDIMSLSEISRAMSFVILSWLLYSKILTLFILYDL